MQYRWHLHDLVKNDNDQSPLVWDEITYAFLNLNGCTVEVYEWISNFIPYFERM